MNEPAPKPIVHYRGEAYPWIGGACLIPVDHPRAELNGQLVYTSRPLSWSKATGVIETENTVYVRQLTPTLEPQTEKAGEGDGLQ